jgi:glycosyltransferase involved in cell wall biosynthesis
MKQSSHPLIAIVDSAAQMGGVEFSTLYLAQNVSSDKFSRVVICPSEGDLPNRCRESGIPVKIVIQPRLASTSMQIGNRYLLNPAAWLINFVKLIFAAFRLNKLLRQENVAVVCTKGLFSHFYGGVAARLTNIPCVWHIQDLVSDRAGWLYPAILGYTGHILAKTVIVDASPIRDQLAPYLPPDRLIVLYNGVDTKQFSPDVSGKAVRYEWKVADTDLLIGCVARLTAWKGQDLLVEAFHTIAEKYPNVKLALVGSPVFDNDQFEQRLRGMVETFKLKDKIIFAGFRWDLPQVLAAFDIFAHTSIEKDTSPLAVVSAMAAGKPIVTTQVAGVAELFTPNKDGILVPPKNSAAIAEGVAYLLDNPQQRNKLGENARHTAEQSLTVQRFVEGCEHIFDRVLSIDSTREM